MGENRGGNILSAQVIQREEYQLSWRMEAEASCESAEDWCLESEAILGIRIRYFSIG